MDKGAVFIPAPAPHHCLLLKGLIGLDLFLVHYQIVNFLNIAIAILDFSLLRQQ